MIMISREKTWNGAESAPNHDVDAKREHFCFLFSPTLQRYFYTHYEKESYSANNYNSESVIQQLLCRTTLRQETRMGWENKAAKQTNKKKKSVRREQERANKRRGEIGVSVGR